MTEHKGTVELSGREVPVTVGLEGERVTLTSAGRLVGDWERADCSFRRLTAGDFALRAENEVLVFVPEEPDEFAFASGAALDAEVDGPLVIEPGPEPKLITRVLFYALAALTVALGAWAGVSLFG